MGLIAQLLRGLFLRGGLRELGRVGTEVIGAVRPNATRQLELGHDAFVAAQSAHAAEFQNARAGWFDALVNGLNRLPRPMLALGTLGLFVYAMADPAGFGLRMRGLAEVPEPLWWLLGAVVAFYFGARETHHLRAHRSPDPRPGAVIGAPDPAAIDPSLAPAPGAASRTHTNPALRDWIARGEDLNAGRD